VKEYGKEKMIRWFHKTNKDNFIENFNQVYPESFTDFEKRWLSACTINPENP
jgi:hypothetical protein